MAYDTLPQDPVILLSYVNTQIRDCYPSLRAFCEDGGRSAEEIEERLATIGYRYSPERNRFE